MSGMGGGLLAGQGGRPCVGICYLRFIKAFKRVKKTNKYLSIHNSLKEEDELASTGPEVGQAVCGHLLHAEGQGGKVVFKS